MDEELLAMLREAAAHVDRHELPAARRLLEPLAARRNLPAETRAQVLLEWAWVLGAEQRNRQAAEAYAEVIKLADQVGAAGLRCEALLESGILARYEGRLDDADALLTEAGSVAARLSDHLRAGQVLAQRASVAHQRHQFVQAREHLDALAELLPRCPSHQRTEQLRADWAHQTAVSARIAHDFDQARQLLAAARDRYAALGRRIGVANVDRELGAVLDQLGDRPGARQAYGRAFTSYLRAGRRLGAAHVARRLGQMRLLDVPEDPAAEAYARRRFSQALRLGAGEPINRMLSELSLARLDRLAGNLDDAEGRLAALPFGDAPDFRHLSQAALEWGMVKRARGDRAAAIEMFRQALLPLDAGDDPSAASIAHYQLAYDLILDGYVREAKEHAVAAFQLSEGAGRRLGDPADRETFYRDTRQAYILAMHCAARDEDGPTAFAVATAARAEAVAAFIRAGAQFSPELRELVAAITLARRTPVEAGRLPELYRRLDRLTTTELRRNAVPEPMDLAATRASLPRGGHALLVDVLEDEATICNRIWLAPDGTTRVDEVLLPPGVRRWLDRYHAAEPGFAAEFQDDALTALGAAIIPPGLAAALERGDEPALVISTGGLLGPVPVAAIRVGTRCLAELARIAVVPAIALWTALRSRPTRTGTGMAAYLDESVPGSRRERAALMKAFPDAAVLTRDQVRPSIFRAADRAAILLSVHGTAVRGLGQALELGGGDSLTAADLLVCRLPEAVLMPACWAGRLDLRAAAEPLGLPTAALLAGARWVLAGTVDIATTRTATLLGACYAELARGRSPVDALRQVQLDYLRSRGRGQVPPHTWAGLSIVGDGFDPWMATPRPWLDRQTTVAATTMLREVQTWLLDPTGWGLVESALSAALDSVETFDAPTLRTALAALRSSRAQPEATQHMAAPAVVRFRINRLAAALQQATEG
ncbi:CATRA system-associated protein [Micromonospora sp. WMMA1947]|uniref:CATRA system-associated protein n=1 Tax=Micromonospora sp. WMMA1947 TaxID=3015163 RepID=UPI00248D0648|nr:CATRA system-associated protein [Micromonospora sp. WMMA1947]WBC08880.1 CHAT domain-containing protein [Micromonospora sp. WMMA1947]